MLPPKLRSTYESPISRLARTLGKIAAAAGVVAESIVANPERVEQAIKEIAANGS